MEKQLLPRLTPSQLQALADVIGDTSAGLSKSVLKQRLISVGIHVPEETKSISPCYYVIGDNKRTWLYKCLEQELNKQNPAYWRFVETALNPVFFTEDGKQSFFNSLLDAVNKVLIQCGVEVGRNGSINIVEKATSLDEVNRRVNHLKSELQKRLIHQQVLKYCEPDFLRKDYFDAISEASKGLAERVREITGNAKDGGQLFQEVFSCSNPQIVFTSLDTESGRSEFQGLKELLSAFFHLYRNPTAHTPKLNWRVEERYALDALVMISIAHKYLDTCFPMPTSQI